jgi:hypothetical protein
LVSDDGSAERLLAPYHNLQLCTPTKLPPESRHGRAQGPAIPFSGCGAPGKTHLSSQTHPKLLAAMAATTNCTTTLELYARSLGRSGAPASGSLTPCSTISQTAK